MPTALITGGSAGLGRALAAALARDDWDVVIDGRTATRLHHAAEELGRRVVPIPGDVTDPEHRADLVREVERLGRLDLLVNNASTLGPTPMPPVSRLDPIALDDIWLTNVAAPLALAQSLLPRLARDRGVLVNITSDASVEHYERWGGYAASKAALDHLTVTLGVENPNLAAYAVDPGDMRTEMPQAAFPGEEISARPRPDAAGPGLLALVRARPASGRYRAAEFAPALEGATP